MRRARFAVGGALAAVAALLGCYVGGSGDAPSAAVCPANLEPTFTSISSQVLMKSCGTDGSGCHSHAGAMYSGGLDFSSDPYHALLGANGGGQPVANIAGDAGRPLLRVAPGDPGDSFLVLKLKTTSSHDPLYGSGMPYTAPGSVCPATLQTIEQWIDAGALNN